MAFGNFFKQIRDKIDAGKKSTSVDGDPLASTASTATPLPTPNKPIPTAGKAGLPPQRTEVVVPGLKDRSKIVGAKSAGVVANDKDDSVYRARSEQVARIEGVFGEFGPQVCAYMLTQSLTPGGINRVLLKLNIVSRGREQADLQQIEKWLLTHGVPSFCKAVGVRMSAAPSLDAVPKTVIPAVMVKPLNPKKIAESQTPANPRAEQISGSGEMKVPQTAKNPIPTKGTAHVRQVNVAPTSLDGKEVERRERPTSAMNGRQPEVENASTEQQHRRDDSPLGRFLEGED